MRGGSRASLHEAIDRVEPLLQSGNSTALGEELFAVTRLLENSVALRRAISDPTKESQAKADLVGSLLAGKVSDVTMDVVQGMARARWSAASDLVDALEQVGAVALVASAQNAQALGQVEDDLFRFGRILHANADLTRALQDPRQTAQARASLVTSLLGSKVNAVTLALISQATSSPRGRRMAHTLDMFAKVAADRQHRSTANVKTAQPLDQRQCDRLAQALSRIFNRPIHVNIDVDPTLVGGLVIQVGDDVLDGSVLRRMDHVQRQLSS